jgi:hypothetical protein
MSAKLSSSDFKKMVESSIDRRVEEEQMKKDRHKEFLLRLKNSATDFMNILEDEIENHLTQGAYRGRKNVRFQSEQDFAKPFGNVKISTLVYGWRTKHGWDIERFKEIGLSGTPFDQLVEEFRERGIRVRNISDSNKGFGFWLEASFEEEVEKPKIKSTVEIPK